tara:strand:+ start:171 stop:773 length:603 start_codon:yes stop_codon:yes gene_type:complete
MQDQNKTMIYLQAAQAGMQSIHLARGGDTPATRAAYNEAYAAAVERSNATRQINIAEANIAATMQDKVLSNMKIQQNQMQAAAVATLTSAAAGVGGRSVEDVMYGIDSNAINAMEATDAIAEQQIEKLGATIFDAKSKHDSVTETRRSTTGGLLQAFSSIDRKDLDRLATLLDTSDKDTSEQRNGEMTRDEGSFSDNIGG